MIDTHAHLDALEGDLDQILASARAAGVTRVVTIGTGIASSRRAVDIAESHDGVFAALGIDPHQAATPDTRHRGDARRYPLPRTVSISPSCPKGSSASRSRRMCTSTVRSSM